MDTTSKDHMSSNGSQQDPPSHQHPQTEHRHMWFITGPAGCGKSTVANHIAKSLNLPYLEGDEFHPAANIKKMSEGTPLTDQDRWDWLITLRNAGMAKLAGPDASPGVVVTCSALKEKYRDVLRVAQLKARDILVHFVYLHATEGVLLMRVGQRQGHYMGANMVKSQMASLEQPGPDERDVISIDVSGVKEEVEAEALRRVREAVDLALRNDSAQ